MNKRDEKLAKKICLALPDWLKSYTKADHDGYTDEYLHLEWNTEDRAGEPIADQEWDFLVNELVLKTKATKSVDYYNALCKIICEDDDEVVNFDKLTRICMLYATWQQKARAYFQIENYY